MRMWNDSVVSMAVNPYALPRRSQVVVVTLYLIAAVLSLLLAFRVLAGLAYLVGSYVAIALIVFGAVLMFRWNAKVRRLRQG